MTGGDGLARLWGFAGGLVAAGVLSFVLILLLRPLLQRYALARPNARSSHREPTPQGGGIAVIASTVMVSIGAGVLGDASSTGMLLIATVNGAMLFIAVVGGIDDLRPMPIGPRLLLQTLAIAVAIAAIPAEMRVLPLLPWWVERVCLLLGVVWFVNLVNFMDGIDWMTVAEVVPVTGAVAAIGISGLVPSMPVSSTIFAAALFGAMLGFAPFNKPVAKLFLGDVGSLPIGLLLGWLLLQLAGSGELAAALLLPLYYVADATITLFRRIRAREPFWQAHRSHFYQRACDRGLSASDIVGRVFVVNLALAVLAFLTIAYHGAIVIASALAAGVAVVIWLLAALARGKP